MIISFTHMVLTFASALLLEGEITFRSLSWFKGKEIIQRQVQQDIYKSSNKIHEKITRV